MCRVSVNFWLLFGCRVQFGCAVCRFLVIDRSCAENTFGVPCVGLSFTFARVSRTRCSVCRFKLFICSRVGRYLGVP